MRITSSRAALALVLLVPAAAIAQPPEGQPEQPPQQEEQPQPVRPEHETQCNDGNDDDGDGLADCADADCFETTYCHAGGQSEGTDARCSDWVDNDGDGATDCEDSDCAQRQICQTSWHGPPPGGASALSASGDDVPELTGDMSVEDLIGRNGDADGERTDEVCADGVDNDMDGRTDCQDYGCRFDPSVTVCAPSPGTRFSVVAGIGASMIVNETPDIDMSGANELNTTGDVRFHFLQLRALGPIPFIPNSFFLLSIRAERTIRLTFGLFQVPLGNRGHYVQINSGSGNLSTHSIISVAKQPLLDPPFYLTSAFEQGSGAAAEIGGPIDDNDFLRFRVFGAGGSGESSGSVGGRFFRTDDRNFSYTGGAQLQVNFVGHYNRLDTPFLYTPVPLTVALLAGARFDQRPVERFVAWNAFAIVRWWHFLVRAESYTRYVFDYDGLQTAFNVQAGVLLVPRHLMLAADVGGFYSPLPYSTLPAGGFSSSFAAPLEQFQWRFAVHWYYFRNIGILSLLYSETYNEFNPSRPEDPLVVRELRLQAQFRF